MLLLTSLHFAAGYLFLRFASSENGCKLFTRAEAPWQPILRLSLAGAVSSSRAAAAGPRRDEPCLLLQRLGDCTLLRAYACVARWRGRANIFNEVLAVNERQMCTREILLPTYTLRCAGLHRIAELFVAVQQRGDIPNHEGVHVFAESCSTHGEQPHKHSSILINV